MTENEIIEVNEHTKFEEGKEYIARVDNEIKRFKVKKIRAYVIFMIVTGEEQAVWDVTQVLETEKEKYLLAWAFWITPHEGFYHIESYDNMVELARSLTAKLH